LVVSQAKNKNLKEHSGETAYFAAFWQSQLQYIFFQRNLSSAELRTRFMHSRLRTHAESIAFFGGGSREKAVSSLNNAQNLLRKCSNTVGSLFSGSIILSQ
jgi:ABC-type uncharacterized transport system fused permease/ATPase subunit